MKNTKIFRMFIALLTVISVLTVRSQIISATPPQEFTPESIEKMEAELAPGSEFEGQYLTYSFDENGNIIRIDESETKGRSAMTILVLVGTTVVGSLICTVIDEQVVAATGQSGGWWVAQAIQNVLNRPYTGKTYLNCNVYPMHSYEGAMCRQYT